MAALTLAAGPLRAEDGRLEISQSQLPYAITQPGSYVVTDDLVSNSNNTPMISIQASFVTLDLNGHRLLQEHNAPVIRSTNSARFVTVRNGRVRSAYAQDLGLELDSAFNRIEDIECIGFYDVGLYASDHTLVRDCRVREGAYGYSGIRVGPGSLVARSAVGRSVGSGLGVGITGNTGLLVADCSVSDWTSDIAGAIFFGISAAGGVVIADSRVSSNVLAAGGTVQAMDLRSGGVVSRCAVQGNRDEHTNSLGIIAHDAWVIADCSVEGRGHAGVAVSNGSVVARNTLYGPNCDIQAGAGCLVRDNALREGGINVGESCLVAGNSVRRETFMNPLILLSGGGYALQNNLWGWDTAGIQVVGKNSRVDRNNISTFTDIRVDLGSSNLIVRNRFNAMTIIASNDFVGASLAGGVDMSANLPWANIDW